jgi:hypothetical protein
VITQSDVMVKPKSRWLVSLPLFAAGLSTFIAAAFAPRGNSAGLWLIVMGVNVQRWNEEASAAAVK